MARTENVWQQIGTYLTTTNPAGFDILVNGTNKYINFNTISGSTGYGFRDNNGNIEFKNNGGSWAAFTSGGTGDVVGPASAVDSNFASYDTTTGKLIKDSGSKASDFATPSNSLKLDQTTPQTIINGQPIQDTLTASKVVFTDASKKLTSTGIGTSAQFIKGDGSLDSTTYGIGTWTDSSTNTGTNKTLNSNTNYIDADATHQKVFLNLGRAGVIGDVVYVGAWNVANGCSEVSLARANSTATLPAAGILESAGADGTVQSMRVEGILNNVNTNAWSAGTRLYVSATTAGVLTSTRPTTPNFDQAIATVSFQSATVGILDVIRTAYVGTMAYEDTATYATVTAMNAKIADAINDGTTTIAPSQNAVFDALALKDTKTDLTKYSNLNLAEGQMINGKIVPSVAGGILTCALKGMDGNNFSATNPGYIRIDNVNRTITSSSSPALTSVSGGANYLNLGSAELATKETDLFVYAGWKAGTSELFVCFSRFPGANTFGDFSGYNSTGEKNCIIDIVPASTDVVVNIGRFAATLSAGAGYTWSVPTFDNKNLIQRPIYETRKLTWTPTITWTGGTAPTGGTAFYSYYITGDRVIVLGDISGMTAGVADTQVQFTLPFTSVSSDASVAPCNGSMRVGDTPNLSSSDVVTASPSYIRIFATAVAATKAEFNTIYSI